MIFKGFLIISLAVLCIFPFNREKVYKINFTTGYNSSYISQKKPKRMGCFCLYSNTASTEKCTSVSKTITMVGIAIIILFQGRLKLKLNSKKIYLVPWYFNDCSTQSKDRRAAGYTNVRVTQIKKYINVVYTTTGEGSFL